MKVLISKRAEKAADRIKERWRKHGDDPPGARFPTKKRPQLMRLVLKKSHCHIYFEIQGQKQEVRVLTLWDGRRKRPPKL